VNPTVIPYTEWLAILTALVATGTPGGLWNTASCRLFANNFVPAPGMTLSQLNEATFTGYAAVAITWGTPAYSPAGPAVVTGNLCVFTVGSSPTVFDTIYGYFVTTGTSPQVLLFARQFATPVVLSSAGQICDVVPSYATYFPN